METAFRWSEFWDTFVNPIDVKGDMEGASADVEDGQNVGFERISDHKERFGLDVEMPDEFEVCFGVFFAHDFDVMEIPGDG